MVKKMFVRSLEDKSQFVCQTRELSDIKLSEKSQFVCQTRELSDIKLSETREGVL